MELTKSISKQSFAKKIIAAIIATAAAIALPQIFHAIGAVSGMGAAVGASFLPMHIPVLLAGFIAGPVVGAAAGLFSPLLSMLLSGMPAVVLMPYMMVELCIYGLVCGLLKNTKLPVTLSLIIAMVAGRAVKAAAILLGVYAFSSPIALPVIWTAIIEGLPGIVLQLVLIPLIMFRINSRKTGEEK